MSITNWSFGQFFILLLEWGPSQGTHLLGSVLGLTILEVLNGACILPRYAK